MFAIRVIASNTESKIDRAFPVDYGMPKPSLLKEVILMIPDDQGFDFIQDFVFCVRPTLKDTDPESAITWNSLPVELVYESQRAPRNVRNWKYQLLADIITSRIRVATAHLLPGSFTLPSIAILAESNQDIGLGDRYVSVCANPGFPEEHAEMFTFGFLLRPPEDIGRAGNGYKGYPARTATALQGILIRYCLLEKLFDKVVPEPLLADIIRLQTLVRAVAEAAAFNLLHPIGLIPEMATMRFALLPWLRFLAQLRHVAVTLHDLSGDWHELPPYNAAGSGVPE